jgi:hypothetical protein
MHFLRTSAREPEVERSPRSVTGRGSGRADERRRQLPTSTPLHRTRCSGLQRSARPVEVEPDTSLRSRSKSHGAQLCGVRVDIVERHAKISCQIARTDEPESWRADARDLHDPPGCGLSDGVNVLCAQPWMRDSDRRRIRIEVVELPHNRGGLTRACGSLRTHIGLWFDRYRIKAQKGRNLQALPVRQPSRYERSGGAFGLKVKQRARVHATARRSRKPVWAFPSIGGSNPSSPCRYADRAWLLAIPRFSLDPTAVGSRSHGVTFRRVSVPSRSQARCPWARIRSVDRP